MPWIEDSELILRERYGWYEAYGIGYPEETFAWLRDAMGPDVPIDLRLRGGEVFRLGPRLAVEILHAAGPLARSRRRLGAELPHGDRHGCGDGERAARHRRQRHPPAADRRRRRVRGIGAAAAEPCAGATADGALRRDRGRRRPPLPGRQPRLRRACPAGGRGSAGISRCASCSSARTPSLARSPRCRTSSRRRCARSSASRGRSRSHDAGR